MWAVLLSTFSQGYVVGIALLWKNEGGIKIINSCNNFIDFEIMHDQVGRWRYTGYYGFPERSKQVVSWRMLRKLAEVSSLPWCIIGDFNDLMLTDEKIGGQKHPYALLAGFSKTVMDCGLSDLGYIGEKYTWERARGTEGWIQQRLDRGLATKEWMELFPNAEVRVLEVSTYDHMPLYLQLNRKVYVPKERRFCFENMWIQEKECHYIIMECWNNGDNSELLDKIARCCARLEEWGVGC